MKSFIKLPVKILTKKIPGRQDSIFYAGKNIAEIKVLTRTYVLTTAGQYKFSLEEGGKIIAFESYQPGKGRKVISKLTDKKIKALEDNNLLSNWGWFGINVWEICPDYLSQSAFICAQADHKETCLDTAVEVYSDYDEAIKSFIEFVEKDLTKTK